MSSFVSQNISAPQEVSDGLDNPPFWQSVLEFNILLPYSIRYLNEAWQHIEFLS